MSDSRVDTVLGLEVANERKFQVRSQVRVIEAVECLLDRAQFCSSFRGASADLRTSSPGSFHLGEIVPLSLRAAWLL